MMNANKWSIVSMLLTLTPVTACWAGDHIMKSLNATIRADDCTNNSTHCHCAMKAATTTSQCIKLMSGETDQCYKDACAGGYQCDCDSNDICGKVSTVYYQATGDSTSEQFQCSQEVATVPRVIVGRTSDFHIIAYQEFQLFVNSEQVGFGLSSVYKVLTAEVRSGDVIALIAKRISADVYGIKLKFTDLEDETRVIDENWYCSSTYISSWLDSSFDPVAESWMAPSAATTISDASFDADVSWMWFGSAETVYMRYVIP